MIHQADCSSYHNSRNAAAITAVNHSEQRASQPTSAHYPIIPRHRQTDDITHISYIVSGGARSLAAAQISQSISAQLHRTSYCTDGAQ